MQPFTTVVPAPAPAKPTTPPVVPPKPTKEEEPRGAFDRGTRATYTPKVWDEQEVEKRKQELGKGYVQTFLKRYANINCKVLAEEAERLLKIADEQRIPTTLASLGQALRIMRKNAGMPNISGRGEKKVAPAPQPVPMTTAKPTTASTTTEVRYEMSESANETLKLIDDLAAGMTLLREHFIKAEKRVADANRRMKVMHEAIQALKNLDALDK